MSKKKNANDGVERERKLSAPAGFELPDLQGVDDAVIAVPMPDLELEATYYDTADLRLARGGISVRFRTGEGRKGKWTVKLPEGDRGPSLVRREIDVAASGRSMPTEVASLVRAHTRSDALAPVGVLHTRRRRVEVRTDADAPLVEVADDEVSVLDGTDVTLRFRELEVEQLDATAADTLVDRVVDALLAAGAAPADQTPKIVRALGPRALARPDVVAPELDGKSTMAEVVEASIANAVLRLVQHDPGVRLGGDPEDVHQARVATRRLRSDLRTFRSLVDGEWSTDVRAELQWLGAAFGHVRDADVLHERLRVHASLLPPEDGAATAALLQRLGDQRAAARRALLSTLDGDRYLGLLDALVEAARRPPLAGEEDGGAPARKVLPGVVRGPWKHLQKAVESLDAHPEDAALHDIRIRAKRARYAAEAGVSVVGKPAAKFAKAVAGVQTVLGDLQDAVVAETWLRTAAAKSGPGPALVAGQLIALQREAMVVARRDWAKAWDDASGKKLRSWLD